MDDLVQATGLTEISKSTVSKLCRDIDERVGAFLDRPLTGDWPCLWLDATYLRQREGGRIVSVAAIVAVAVNTDGKREIVGLHIGPLEADICWSTFLNSWSGQISVFLNGRRIYAGNNPYYPVASRISADDRLAPDNASMPLDLLTRHNELVLAVGNGWPDDKGALVAGHDGWGAEGHLDAPESGGAPVEHR